MESARAYGIFIRVGEVSEIERSVHEIERSNDVDDGAEEDAKKKKMILYFTSEIHDCLDLFVAPVLKLTMQRRRPNPKSVEIRTFSRARPRSVDEADLGHFTLLFRRERQRNEQRFITHVCTAIILLIKSFCLVTFSFSSSSWFAKLPNNMTLITSCRNVISIDHTSSAIFAVPWLVLPFRERNNFKQLSYKHIPM